MKLSHEYESGYVSIVCHNPFAQEDRDSANVAKRLDWFNGYYDGRTDRKHTDTFQNHGLSTMREDRENERNRDLSVA